MNKEEMQRIKEEIIALRRELKRVEITEKRTGLRYKLIDYRIQKLHSSFIDARQVQLLHTLAELRHVWGKRLNWTDEDFKK
tara:strand:+ start:13002 stop:13244 length:243 start_codon:yes stop_codon:yes gene_type:complete